jgi:NitT/TauT family transport system substrate-binding protein
MRNGFRTGLCALALVGAGTLAAHAEQLAITQYGITAGGYAYAVALAKGYFKEEGADVSGIISSQGGGTSIRNMLSADVPYGEVNPGAAMAAIQQGVELKIIADTMPSVGDLNWVVKKDSKIQSMADLKGKKIGYTQPKSTTYALDLMFVEAAKLKPEDVELVRTGGFGEGLAALDSGLIDVAPIGEPLSTKNQDKFRSIAVAGNVLPLLDNVVAVTTPQAAQSKADFIRAVLRARRRGAEFIYTNTEEAADLIAEVYKADKALMRASLKNLVALNTEGVRYISDGRFHPKSMQRMIDLQKRVGAIDGDVDVTKHLDASFLPKDLQEPK